MIQAATYVKEILHCNDLLKNAFIRAKVRSQVVVVVVVLVVVVVVVLFVVTLSPPITPPYTTDTPMYSLSLSLSANPHHNAYRDPNGKECFIRNQGEISSSCAGSGDIC